MSSEIYAIVFKGQVIEGFDATKVQAQLARLLKADAKKAAALFSGKQIVLKKTADKAEAARYGKALKKVGADVKIRVIKSGDAAAASPKPSAKPAFQKAEPPAFEKADDAPAFQKAEPEPAAAPEPAVAESASEPAAEPPGTAGITVAPNEGNLFDPAPAVEAPPIDLSAYTVAENDGSPLVEASGEVIDLDLDLSAFSVSENDGSPLVEASNEEVPEVDVPDFGLDEPGAVLETLKEEKEIVNPNTMGMSIATAGSDLIEEEDKPRDPPPRVPDTSKINLVPNFDT